jgi:hypothetical protein
MGDDTVTTQAAPLAMTTTEAREGGKAPARTDSGWHYTAEFFPAGQHTPGSYPGQLADVYARHTGIFAFDLDLYKPVMAQAWAISATGRYLAGRAAYVRRGTEESIRFLVAMTPEQAAAWWPVASGTPWGDIRSAGLAPSPGAVHPSGEIYEVVPGPDPVAYPDGTVLLTNVIRFDDGLKAALTEDGAHCADDREMVTGDADLPDDDGRCLLVLRWLGNPEHFSSTTPRGSHANSAVNYLKLLDAEGHHIGGHIDEAIEALPHTSAKDFEDMWATAPVPADTVATGHWCCSDTIADLLGRASLNGQQQAPAQAPPDGQQQAPVQFPDRGLLEVTNAAELFDVLRDELGAGSLAGVFTRGGKLVVVPRYGEAGYRPAGKERTAADPPAQVRELTEQALIPFVAERRLCYRVHPKAGPRPALPPAAACAAVVNAQPGAWTAAPPLAGVTHTPLLRGDGTILDRPGYDPATALLYLPDCQVPPVPETPGDADVQRARDWLGWLVRDFRFVTEADRANYLGALITPVMRLVLPPPWPVLALNAPMFGSGKTLLSELARIVHGGVQHTAPDGRPGDVNEELRKKITTILSEQTGGVVVFDNVTGVLRSGTLAALLTAEAWSDRLLGGNRSFTGPNDRLWVITGNNIALGGDLPRRALWATIDPGVPEPWDRPPAAFAEPDLPGWARQNRGTLLWALLVLARHGQLVKDTVRQARTDGYGKWAAGIAHVLAAAGIPGGFWAKATNVAAVGADDEDWAELLAAIWSSWGNQRWTSRQLAEACLAPLARGEVAWTPRRLSVIGEVLPEQLADKLARDMTHPEKLSKPLGWWLKNRTGRWAGGYMVKSDGGTHARTTQWWVTKA